MTNVLLFILMAQFQLDQKKRFSFLPLTPLHFFFWNKVPRSNRRTYSNSSRRSWTVWSASSYWTSDMIRHIVMKLSFNTSLRTLNDSSSINQTSQGWLTHWSCISERSPRNTMLAFFCSGHFYKKQLKSVAIHWVAAPAVMRTWMDLEADCITVTQLCLHSLEAVRRTSN